MQPNAPTVFISTAILGVGAVAVIGWSVVWTVFAVTLLVTTLVAIHRSIPRKER